MKTRYRRIPTEGKRDIPEGEYLGPNYKKWLHKIVFPAVNDTGHDDSRLFLVFGKPGTGKSTLSLLSMKEYYGKEVDPGTIASDKESLGRVFKTIRIQTKNGEPAGAFMHDEANYSKYTQGSHYEKKTREYFSVQRERNYLFFFNSAKGNEFDKEFLDLFHYAIFVAARGRFYVIKMKNLLQWVRDGNKLNVDTLERDGIVNIALFRSSWKKYSGPDWKAYLKVKRERMDVQSEEIENYFIKEDGLSQNEMAKKLGLGNSTVSRHLPKAIEMGYVKGDCRTPGGRYSFTSEQMEGFWDYYQQHGGVGS